MKERKKNRLINFDYSSDNLYFVTNCTKDNIRCFGEIKNGSMVLNEMGEIAHQQWQWLVERCSYLISHAFVVMPNHIHGVLGINRGIVGTGRDLSVPPQKIKSLSELMGAYKTTVSKKIHLLGYDTFAWHRSFYDYIIRDRKSFEKIVIYIMNNPLVWNDDTYNYERREGRDLSPKNTESY